jgi:hypothetical protein
MVAGMALMESPAIIAGLIIVKFALNKTDESSQTRMSKVFHEAFTNGSVLLLIGSMVICNESEFNTIKELIAPYVKEVEGMIYVSQIELL